MTSALFVPRALSMLTAASTTSSFAVTRRTMHKTNKPTGIRSRSAVRTVAATASTAAAFNASTDVVQMKVSELSDILRGGAEDAYQLVDVREPSELDLAKLDGFTNLPLSRWTETTADVLDPEKPTICLCHHGMRSQQVAMFLKQRANFQEVYNVVGGIASYAEEVDSSVGTY
ncbi:hypothetical protein PPROV_000952900 [Pycnococcus provasolii]|uniref:Rhodanese domain-containing protein n=1 Tax=Pycnococcus provasolii TaxID=41880 RepID=A0A830HV27_9CHLO|nr:hypothetical protein PPROV_000952900 [Pycnococcus provasolii]|mmetsp:Transcript_3314/g.7473  ORF Transcript_3314/g.7473 Transcript_3314/m.7473 type:complete len:173 (-) Transcript_3314:144-662(-)